MVEEEKIENKAAEENPQSAEEYVAIINRFKENTVPKEKYEALLKDKEVLTKALAGEGPVPEGVQEKGKRADINELRKRFINAGEENLSNAQYIKLTLDLRQAIIDEGGTDPFLPHGAKISPTPQDIAGAQKAADAFQSWLDAATDENGKIDDELFNAYLKKGIADDSPMLRARLRANQKAR